MLAQSHFHASLNGGIWIGRLKSDMADRGIYEQRSGPEHMRWFKSLYGMFGVPAELRSDGQGATLDEARRNSRRPGGGGWRGRS